MSDLIAMLILAAAFCSLATIGVVVLLCGLVIAQRTSSVLACAAVAAVLFTVQLSWMAFWHSFGVGVGGEVWRGASLIQWGGVVAATLVAGFLALKLPGTLERSIETAGWSRDSTKISAVTAVVYVLHLLAVEVLPWTFAAKSNGVTSPTLTIWLSVVAGLALAWALWGRLQWAWHAAVACTVCAIGGILWLAYPALAKGRFLAITTTSGVRLLILTFLLGMLLFSNARELCVRRRWSV